MGRTGLDAALRKLGYTEIEPASLRRYLIGVSAYGPIPAIAFLAYWAPALTRHEISIAIVLTLLAAVGERFPLHLTHKTSINVASAAYIAMILTLPWQWPGVLALLALTVGLCSRRLFGRGPDSMEILFNIGQGTLYVTSGALALAIADQVFAGPQVGSIGSLPAIVAAAGAMHLVNTAAVAGATGLQLGVSPVRIWWRNLGLDLTPQVTLTVFGILAAMIAREAVWLTPMLSLPGLLTWRAVRETVQLRANTHEALASLVEVVEMRDPYTAGHSNRVANNARALATQLRLTPEEADNIQSAGRVHDIGKVAIDPSILVKTTKLTDSEWREMQLHPVFGANVIERFEAYRDCASFVRHHHEQWDGNGYPDRIAGESIPLGARILAVVDSFDAMTSDRPYRAGMPIQQAMSVLHNGAGQQWDANVVDAFITLLHERPGEVEVCRRNETSSTVASALMSERSPLVVEQRDVA